MTRVKFPVLATIILIFAVFWLLNELEILILDIPWIPVILIVIAIGLIFNRFTKN